MTKFNRIMVSINGNPSYVITTSPQKASDNPIKLPTTLGISGKLLLKAMAHFCKLIILLLDAIDLFPL